MSRISSAGSIGAQTPNAANDLRDLEVDQFLKLMIVGLQNQDPLNPADNSDLIQQIGQIREISATNLLTNTLQAVLTGQNLSTASSLIGKEISALTDDGENVQGIVDRVSVEVNAENNKRTLRVHVGPHAVELDNVREITTDDSSE